MPAAIGAVKAKTALADLSEKFKFAAYAADFSEEQHHFAPVQLKRIEQRASGYVEGGEP